MNTQPVEKQISEDGDPNYLDVTDIWPTIQGEGLFAGRRAVFIRLAGCNMSGICRLCDTDYTSYRKVVPIENILTTVKSQFDKFQIPKGVGGSLDYHGRLVVITGGEPFRQNISALVYKLLHLEYIVQIETNGTLPPLGKTAFDEVLGDDNLWIVCSSKSPSVNSGLLPHIDSFKYVLEHGHVDEKDGLPTSVLGTSLTPYRPFSDNSNSFPLEQIFVQPVDTKDPEQNKLNYQAAADSCMKFGYTLSFQMHKLFDLP